MAPRRKSNRGGDATPGGAKRRGEADEQAGPDTAEQPTERRVYARAPRTWEQWDEPLRQRVVGKRVVKWSRLRISRSESQPDS